MDKETYGVELVLMLDKFRNKINEAKNYMGDFSNRAKRQLTTGINIDTKKAREELDFFSKKNNEAFEKAKQDYEALQKAQKKLSLMPTESGTYGPNGTTYTQKELDRTRQEVAQLEKQFESSAGAVSNYENQFNILKKDLEDANSVFGKIGSFIGKIFPKKDTEDAKNKTEEIKEGINGINEASGGSKSNNLSNMFTKGIKSLKRFALSLFGLQSIWRILSRASSAYLSQNKELSNKIQAVWNGLGTLLGPVIDFLADIFMKLIGYINVVTKALWNFDFVAKANANTLKNYQKQAQKTSKALGGMDELTNLSQQNDSNSKGPALLEIPPLDEGIVKGLQDISKWLKDNWDWLGKVLIAFGLVFGASAVAGWLTNIGRLLGVAGVGGTGGAGLLGLSSTLSWIAGLGTLAVEIFIAYKYGKDAGKADKAEVEAMNNWEDTIEEGHEIVKTNNNTAKSYKQNTIEVNKYIASLENEIEANADIIHDNEKWYDSLDGIGMTIATVTGKLSEKAKQSKKAAERIDELVAIYGEYYNRGQLNNQQIAYYLELLKYQNKAVSDNEITISKLAYKYVDLTENIYRTSQENENSLEVMKAQSGVAGALGTAISVLGNRDFAGLQKKIEDNERALRNYGITAEDAKRKLNDLVNGRYQVGLSINVKIETEALRRALERVKSSPAGLIGGAVGFSYTYFQEELEKLLRSLSGYKIGTDLVRSDGLAYLHAGEQVVPADAVSGGWTGGNNNETNSLLRELIETVQSKNITATISSNDVGKASVDYIRNQNRIMGGSVI